MASTPPPTSISLAPPAEPARTISDVQNNSGPAAETADKLRAELLASQKNELLPDNLMVRLDKDAQRFVQTISDAQTNATLLRYPSEEQLAYSRAVVAYLRALTQS